MTRADPAGELLDVLDERGRPTGAVKPRGAVHRDGDWHRAVHLWVVSGSEVLLQRRAASKAAWPGRLDATASGHVGAGEEPLAAGLREAEEELGTRYTPEEVVVLGERPLSDRPAPAMVNREHQLVAVVRDDRRLDAWTGLDRAELDGLVAVELPAFCELAFDDDGDEAAGRWPARGTDAATTEVRAGEVLRPPYLRVLAIMLERFAAGRGPLAV